MRRRTLIIAGLAAPLAAPLAACDLIPGEPLIIVCDPELVPVMEAAAAAWPDLRGGPVQVGSDISARALGAKMAANQGGVAVTREIRQADRLQRMGVARLENRWTRSIAGTPVHIVVNQGDWMQQRASTAFAKWLASPEADRAVAAAEPPSARPMRITLLTVP